jgi:hypothetical protein
MQKHEKYKKQSNMTFPKFNNSLVTNNNYSEMYNNSDKEF